MATTIKLEGVPPLDGVYPFDADTFDGNEMHLIKKISGVRGGELKEAIEAGDYDLVIAFAVIALQRAGKKVSADQLRAAAIGTITFDAGEAEAEERPPSSASPNGSESSSDESNAPHENTSRSGEDSVPIGVTPPNDPSPTGPPGSETSAGSVREMSAS